MTYSPAVPMAKHKAGLIMALSFALLSISLIAPLMSWVVVLTLCAVSVRICLYLGWYPQPPETRTVNLLAVLSVLALGWFGLQQGLLLSMVNLLVTACSLKLMVMRSQKDYLQLFLSMVFVAGCGYIFEQGIGFVAIYSVLVVALFTSLALQYGSNQLVLAQLRQLLLLSVQSLPIAALLFLVFPQLPPLWKMPSAGGASVGLSDTIRPGDIANLSQSSDLAFRARFESTIPEPVQLYWRGIVLEHFDGAEWTVSERRKAWHRRARQLNREFAPEIMGSAWEYRVFAEASRQRWLFTLDVPTPASVSTSNKVWQTATYTFQAEQPLMSAMAYDAKSYPNVRLNQTRQAADQFLNRQLPQSGNQRTRNWVTSLRTQYPNDRDFINAIQAFFISQNFKYTLTPPLMQTDGIDQFLFDEQRGFCSHYASAMAFALRVGGIPARLVAGYQGGEGLDDNVVSVFQYDAHAWVEAWFDDSGWVRFDPTGLVAPDRLTFGLQRALEDKTEFLANAPLSLRHFEHLALLRNLREALDKMDYLWSQWVLGYDRQQQQDLFKDIIGALTPEKLIFLMLGVVATIALILAVFFLPSLLARDSDPIVRYYLKSVAWLENKTGIKRNHLPPYAYQALVSKHLSAKAQQELDSFTKLFVQSQYHKGDDTTGLLKQLKYHFTQLKRHP